jgi:DNA polymerase-1
VQGSGLTLLVDGSNLMWRSLHGCRPLNRPSDGAATHAALNFIAGLSALISRYRPVRGAVVFDGPGPSFRVLMTESYKGNRERVEPTEDDLRQVRWMRRVVKATGLSLTDSEPYEADDVLATLSRRIRSRVVVASDDKDLECLVEDGRVVIHRFRDGSRVDEAAVRERWGVAPSSVSDLLAIAGDSGDGHGGVPGIGPAAAKALIDAHRSVEGILLAGPSIRAVKWSRLAPHAHSLRRMAAVTRPVDAMVSRPGLLDREWPVGVARVIAALEAPKTLSAFCQARGVNPSSITPDPEVASAAVRAIRHGRVRKGTWNRPKP